MVHQLPFVVALVIDSVVHLGNSQARILLWRRVPVATAQGPVVVSAAVMVANVAAVAVAVAAVVLEPGELVLAVVFAQVAAAVASMAPKTIVVAHTTGSEVHLKAEPEVRAGFVGVVHDYKVLAMKDVEVEKAEMCSSLSVEREELKVAACSHHNSSWRFQHLRLSMVDPVERIPTAAEKNTVGWIHGAVIEETYRERTAFAAGSWCWAIAEEGPVHRYTNSKSDRAVKVVVVVDKILRAVR